MFAGQNPRVRHLSAGMPKKGLDRRHYDDDLKREAVQMVLDGYSATSIASNLGIRNANLIHKWKKKQLSESPVAESLESEVQDLREKLSRVERECDILKKSVEHFQPKDLKKVCRVVRHIHWCGFSVASICDALHVSRSSYYAFEKSLSSQRAIEDERLGDLVTNVFQTHRGRYGACQGREHCCRSCKINTPKRS